ncbi:hypothetical protein [Novosphingobium sp. THN1]|nr:hypothetical protein [Novosphingobium sp. THN1]
MLRQLERIDRRSEDDPAIRAVPPGSELRGEGVGLGDESAGLVE